jgi:hypothetical protein
MDHSINRCKFTTADTGTGSSLTVAARYSAAFFTPAQAGAVDGRRYTYVIQQGNDIEIQQDQVYTTSGTSIARGTPSISIVGGTVGTTKITLDTTQVISFGASAADLMFAQTRGADVVAAGTLVLDTTTGKQVNMTGSTTITAVTLADGQERWVYVSSGTPQITVGASLVGNGGGANITLAVGDLVRFQGYASSVVRFHVIRLSGKSVVAPAAADISDSGAIGRSLMQSSTIAAALTALGLSAPSRQIFLTGSGTYTTPAGVRWLRVRLVGGAGGGSGSGTTAGGAAASGSNTTFSTLTGSGGTAASGTTQGTGGAASGGNIINAPGSDGFPSPAAINASTFYIAGGNGGASIFGGAGKGGNPGSSAGNAGATNSGSGGGGGSGNLFNSGAGGAAGGYVEHLIAPVSATYSYSVGAGGAAGTVGGGGGLAGGNGAAGQIIVEEFY